MILRKLSQCDEHFLIGGFSEALDTYVASFIVEHVGRCDAVGRYFTTSNCELFHTFFTVAHDANLYFCVFRAFQPMHSFFVRHNLSNEEAVVDGHDFVACQQSGSFSRSVLDDTLHVDGVFANDKLNAYTREGASQVVCCSLYVLCGNVDRMRIEVGENLWNGLFHE